MSSCTATDGMDYSLPGDFQIEFGSSSLSGVSECVNVTISNDELVEGREDFVVMVTSVMPQVELSGSDSVTVIIVDNNCEIPNLCPPTYIVVIFSTLIHVHVPNHGQCPCFILGFSVKLWPFKYLPSTHTHSHSCNGLLLSRQCNSD